MEAFKVETFELGDERVVLTVMGEVDIATYPILEAALVSASITHKTLVIDLTEVSFLSLDSLPKLASVAASVEHLILRNSSSMARLILGMLDLDLMFEFDGWAA